MIAALDIPVTKVSKSKLSEIDFNHLPFGKYFTDHMLVADYTDGVWKNLSIMPFEPLPLLPSLAALHYGQTIFEGIKAYKNKEGNAIIFRPYDNFKRFNQSAWRMHMPAITEEIFIEGMKKLIAVDKDWIPHKEDYSLYIRPLMFASDTSIGVRPSLSYKFIIMLSPCGPYYTEPMKIYVEEKYSRSAPGGVGAAKNAGNYGASMLATALAQKEGYHQVLWTDACEHVWLQEVGTMNVFFVLKNKVITPSLEEGTILEGVTRATAITLLKDKGYEVEERKIHINELIDEYKKGNFTEAFGTGTAAIVSPIKELKYRDFVMQFHENKIAHTIKKSLADIHEGNVPDSYNWLVAV